MLLRDPLKTMLSEHARVQTGSSWAENDAVISSVLTFHTLIVESDEPLNSTSLLKKQLGLETRPVQIKS